MVSLDHLQLTLPLLLAMAFSASVLITGAVLTFKEFSPSAVKLLGSSMVLALSFAANSVWTYGIAIFVVATLVTELEFLEKLAALFTNRKEYWDYLLRKASTTEIDEKVETEARAAAAHQDIKSDNILIYDLKVFANDYKNFEVEVASAIENRSPPFEDLSELNTNFVIQRRLVSRQRVIIDAVIKVGIVHFVAELKSGEFVGRQGVYQAASNARLYEEYLAERKITAVVVPVLIIKSSAKLNFQPRKSIVLRFESENKTFLEPLEFWSSVDNIVSRSE